MTLYELGQEYKEKTEMLLKRIHKLNLLSKEAKNNDLIYLKRRIYSLYCDAAQCKKTAEHLMKYYN